ncbi:hypothetical protein [Sphingobacterium sp. MYb382]|uniref:hypothetical protein n=1 Tax=Sphingobacterium sp. MYb382 TaxID=2745278 RepID=UPI0030B50CC1
MAYYTLALQTLFSGILVANEDDMLVIQHVDFLNDASTCHPEPVEGQHDSLDGLVQTS